MRYKLPDHPFQRLAQLLIFLFLAVALAAGYWGVVRAEDLYSTMDFRRQMQRELAVNRGRILAADGSAIAETHFNEEGEAERVYRYEPLAPVTGHWSIIYGRTGLEAAYDDFLSGRRGQRGMDVLNEIMHEEIVGADVVTTIRPQLQVAADQQLGNRAGAVVVMNPRDGKILAMASHPTYNPNNYDERAEEIVNDPRQPLLNRATRGMYTPGSVFKVVTLAGALTQEVTTPDERFKNEKGIFIVEGYPVREGSELPQQNAPYDLYHALAYSSNVTFAQLALRMGPDGMRETARDFGLEEAPPLEVTTEASRLGTDASLLDQVGLANAGYGQGQLLMTPLHMALVAAAAANDGVVMEPHLVDSIRTRDGNTVLEKQPRPWKQAISKGVARQVREGMVVSAKDGFARAGAPPGIEIGGKTGTAQLDGAQDPHSWFIAFAPVEDPQVAVAVIVENGGAGGDVAAPIARELIRLALTAE